MGYRLFAGLRGWNLFSLVALVISLVSMVVAVISALMMCGSESDIFHYIFIWALAVSGFISQTVNLYFAMKRRNYKWVINTIVFIAVIILFLICML